MEDLLWGAVLISTIALAYSLQFTRATLAVGLELSSTKTDTGFQNAVTPPWEVAFSLEPVMNMIPTE